LPLPNILRGHGRTAARDPRDTGADAPRAGPTSNGASSPPDWKRLKAEVLERDHHQCQLQLPGCERNGSEIDRIGSLGDPAGGSREELRAACKSCERSKASAFRLLD
jgi:hypothetical protein